MAVSRALSTVFLSPNKRKLCICIKTGAGLDGKHRSIAESQV